MRTSQPWIDGEKLEECPECGRSLNQKEYDFQFCYSCTTKKACATGLNNPDIKRRHLAQVREYYATHLGCSRKECAYALGLTRQTVGRHLKTIQNEWRLSWKTKNARTSTDTSSNSTTTTTAKPARTIRHRVNRVNRSTKEQVS